jgi:hypothetical protein
MCYVCTYVHNMALLIAGPTASPLSPPTNLRAQVLSEQTAWLQWYDPSLGRTQQFTDERYYNVHYQVICFVITYSCIGSKTIKVTLHVFTHTFKNININYHQ